MAKKVLLVDDEVQLLEIITWELEDLGCEVVSVSSGMSAINKMKSENFDLVISDIKMPDGDGFFLLKSLRDVGVNTPIVFVSGFSQYDESELVEAGAMALISKPINMAKVAKLIKSIPEKQAG